MEKHGFIMTPGKWLGEGKVGFNASDQQIQFATRWMIDPLDDDSIFCTQDVEMHGSTDVVHNAFRLFEIGPKQFAIELENESIGRVTGSGLIEPKRIAWEFRNHLNFQGFEVYELKENGEYHFHAEYASAKDQFRTLIDGRIWKD